MMKSNYIEKLLNGAKVEWKKLGEVTEIISGYVFPKKYQGDTISSIPFYKVSDMNNFGNEIYMKISNNYLSDKVFDELRVKTAPKGTIVFPKIGKAIATNKKRILSQSSVFDNNIVGLIPRNEILSGYLFHFFQTVDLMSLASGSGAVPSISKKSIEKFKIPIPPLRVQEEIVRILDTFTELIAELTAELTARKNQYEYYRDKLLTPIEINGKWFLNGKEVEWKKLGEVAELKRGRVISKVYLEDNVGEYPVYSSQTVNNGEIGKINTYDFDGEFITWTTDGANAGTVFYRKGKFSITNVCGLIKIINIKELNYKYLSYWLFIEAKKHVYSGMGNPKLMSNQAAKIPIPIPPLEEQERIVSILDKFDALTNSITEGLPREIELRQKQYEYYRDMLLNFPKKEN